MAYFEVKSPKRGAKLRLDAPFFVIGRGERIPIFHDDPSISREHAAIVIRKAGVRIRDLGSKNGILLNGEPIPRYSEVELKPGDSLRVGGTTLVLREGEPPPQEPKPVPSGVEAPRHETLELPPVPAGPDAVGVDGSITGSAMTGVNLIIKTDSAEDQPIEDLSKIEEREALPLVTGSSVDEESADEEDEIEELDDEAPQLE